MRILVRRRFYDKSVEATESREMVRETAAMATQPFLIDGMRRCGHLACRSTSLLRCSSSPAAPSSSSSNLPRDSGHWGLREL